MSAPARISAAAMLAALLAAPLMAEDAAPAPAADAAAPAPAADAAPAAAPAKSATADTVLAVVNGENITLGNVIALVNDLPQQYQQLPDDALFKGVLDQMVQQLVLSESFSDPDRAEALTLENQSRAVKAGLSVQRILAEPVSDEELQAAYDKLYAHAKPQEEFHASHILVKTEDEAKAIEEQLKNGGDFAAIAKEKSQDPGSAAAGGDLGWFGEGMMVPEFENAVKTLKPGETSAPVQSQFGWHIIRLDETREVAQPTLDEVRGKLVDQIKSDRVEAAIARAEQSAQIDRSGAEGVDPASIRRMDLLKD